MSQVPARKPDAWREALRIINRCPICQDNYPAETAQLFAKNESASMVHITCTKCNSGFMAMIVLLGQGLSSVGMVTDLSFEDAKRLHEQDPLTIDEVINAHEQIQNINFFQSNLFESSNKSV